MCLLEGETSMCSLARGMPVLLLQSPLVCLCHVLGAGLLSTPFSSWETNTQSNFYLFIFNGLFLLPWCQDTKSTHLCISMIWSNLRSPSEILVDNLNSWNVLSFPIPHLLLSEDNSYSFQLRMMVTSKIWLSQKSLETMWMVTVSREDSLYMLLFLCSWGKWLEMR